MKTISMLLLATCFVSVCFAQDALSVSGTAQDKSGAVIPDEKLILINKTTGASRTATADRRGDFRFTRVMPGNYLLRGEADGFVAAELPLALVDKSLAGINVVMKISRAEEVTVTATNSQPDAPENNANAVYFNSDMIVGLPSQSQDILPILSNFLSPAAQGPQGPSIIVDGVETDDLNLPTDSLKRIFINKNPYSAEFRRPGLGRVEVITRNGSRGHYDGSAAVYVRNDALDARNAFAATKPDLSRRLFEANLGGPLPIRHARFFLSASRLLDNESAVVNATALSGPVLQNIPTSNTNTNLIGRVDLRPDEANNLALFYTFHDAPAQVRGVGGLRLPEHGINTDDRRHKFQASDTTVVSPTFLNIVRFDFERRAKHDGREPQIPEIDVLGAFTGGSNQAGLLRQETKLEFQDIANYTHGSHTLRFGGAFKPKSFTFADATNFGGTFTFPNLAAFSSRSPTLFQIIRGNPSLSFSQDGAYGFLQDEIKLTQRSTLMLGLRYDWQAKLKDHNNFAPRLAFAVAPGNGETVFRAGAGIFYDYLSDSSVEESLLVNGTQAQEFIQEHPSFPVASLSGVVPSIWRLAPNIRAPYLFQTSFAMERKLRGTMRATIEYQYVRGVHLYRARDVNSPLSGSGPRPDPNFFLVRQIESSASLRSNALVASLQGRMGKVIKMKAQYTLSRSSDDSDAPLALPANSRDLRPEWGRSNFDRRHRLILTGVSDLPAGFRLGGILNVTSGAPFDITTGFDNNSDGIISDRPFEVTRNTGNGPGFAQVDLRLTKVIRFLPDHGREADFRNVDINVDAFNLFNHTNFADIISQLSSPRFGKPHTAFPARTIQLSLKFNFRVNRE